MQEPHQPNFSARDGAARLTLSLRLLLALAFGGLVALAVGTVLTLTVRASFVNTYSLLNTRAIELIDGMERQIHFEAQQAEKVLTTVARLYAQEAIGMDDSPERRAVLTALLTTVPSVEAVFVFSGDGLAGSLFRNPEGTVGPLPESFLDTDLEARFNVDAARRQSGLVWSDPVAIGQSLYHNAALRLMRNGKVEGVAVAIVGQHTVSRIMVRLGRASDATVFMLTNTGGVISHSRLPELFRNRNVLPISGFPDEVLRKLPSAVEDTEFGRAAETGIRVFASPDGRSGHIFLTKELTGTSATPYTLGVYFRKADIGAEILRTRNSMLAGLAGLIAAVAAAIFLGTRISRPMAQIAETASLFSDFRLHEFTSLPRSRIREIDDQAVALNKMHTAMQQFTRYVPRELVARLMRLGEDANRPVERELTILFTDIADFTGYSERLSAAETARVLNAHFEMITHHVQETGGTIDKFIGDGALAFWGAPGADPEQTVHAVEAARAIAHSVREENARRRELGERPLRLRIGIHVGRVVVGNIGGSGRQNYTIVGDPVNVAQRLEQLGREEMGPDDDCIVLVSAPVIAAVGKRARFTPAGTRVIRGRERPIAVSILNTDGAGAGDNVVPFTGSGSA